MITDSEGILLFLVDFLVNSSFCMKIFFLVNWINTATSIFFFIFLLASRLAGGLVWLVLMLNKKG